MRRTIRSQNGGSSNWRSRSLDFGWCSRLRKSMARAPYPIGSAIVDPSKIQPGRRAVIALRLLALQTLARPCRRSDAQLGTEPGDNLLRFVQETVRGVRFRFSGLRFYEG